MSNRSPSQGLARLERWRVPDGLVQASGWAWRFVAVAAALYILVWAVARLQVIVVSVFVSIVAASAMEPGVAWLSRRRVPRIIGVWLILLVLVAVLVAAFWLMIPRFVDELQGMDARLQEGLDEAENWLRTGPLGLSPTEVDDLEEQAVDRATEQLNGLVPDPVAGLSLVAQAVAGIFLTIVLTFYFTKDGASMWRWLLRLLDVRRRHRIDAAGQRALVAVRGWLRGVAITGVFDAVVIGIALVILGVPLAYALALFTFFGAFLPIVGALVTGSLAVLMALASGGATDAIIIGVVVLLVQQIEGDVIMPMVMSRAVALHPVVVLLALTAGGATAGIVGAVVAVPVAAALVAMIGALAEPVPDGGIAVTDPSERVPVEDPSSPPTGGGESPAGGTATGG